MRTRSKRLLWACVTAMLLTAFAGPSAGSVSALSVPRVTVDADQVNMESSGEAIYKASTKRQIYNRMSVWAKDTTRNQANTAAA